MSTNTLEQATEGLYTALNSDELSEIDTALIALRSELDKVNEKSIEIEPTRLPNNTRQGRRMLQSYSAKRGIKVTFPKVK